MTTELKIVRWISVAFSYFLYFAWVATASAESLSGGPIHVSASVPAGLTFDLKIVDQANNTEVPSLDFGELVRTSDEFRSAKFFKVYLTANAAGDPYILTQVGTPLTRVGGSEAIPAGAYIVKPEYIESDNLGLPQPAASFLGGREAAVGTHTLYTDPSGSSRIVTLTYTLSGDPNTGATDVIPLSQKSGSYSGTVQFTLTTT